MFEFTFDDTELEALDNLLRPCFENMDGQLLTWMDGVNPPFPPLLRGDNASGSEYSELDNRNSD